GECCGVTPRAVLFLVANRAYFRQSGRLLCGRPIRDRVCPVDLDELVTEGAELALDKLATPQVIALLSDSAALAEGDVRRLTKWILFPVRLLFTARTAQVAGTETAVDHLGATSSGAPVRLARAALSWRHAAPRDSNACDLIDAGLWPL